jgi:hypothetical protein
LKNLTLKEIHSDYRGSIYLLEGIWGYPELTVFFTKAGCARGGCIHPKSDEHCTVISGHIHYVIGKLEYHMQDGDSRMIPKNTPHYFFSHTDSVILEWGAMPEEKKNKDPELRKVVETINDFADKAHPKR